MSLSSNIELIDLAFKYASSNFAMTGFLFKGASGNLKCIDLDLNDVEIVDIDASLLLRTTLGILKLLLSFNDTSGNIEVFKDASRNVAPARLGPSHTDLFFNLKGSL